MPTKPAAIGLYAWFFKRVEPKYTHSAEKPHTDSDISELVHIVKLDDMPYHEQMSLFENPPEGTDGMFISQQNPN